MKLPVLFLLVILINIWTVYGSSSYDSLEFLKNIDKDNQEAMSMLNQLLYNKEGWKFVNEKDGVTVERRHLSPGSYVDNIDRMKGTKHACIRSKGIINCSAESVFQLFIDNSRVAEYNEHCAELKDVEEISKAGLGNSWTKVAWVTIISHQFLSWFINAVLEYTVLRSVISFCYRIRLKFSRWFHKTIFFHALLLLSVKYIISLLSAGLLPKVWPSRKGERF